MHRILPQDSIDAYTLSEPTHYERLLARAIGKMKKSSWKHFSSGELFVNVGALVKKCVVIGRTYPPAENIWQTLLLVDTLQRNGASDIVVVLPYYAYARQDRPVNPGDPLTGVAIAQLLASAGAGSIVTVELHSKKVADKSPIPVYHVSMLAHMARVYTQKITNGMVPTIVSPDEGGVERARQFADVLGGGGKVVHVEKKRSDKGEAKAIRLHGALTSDRVVIVDDMVDSGGTVVEAVRLLKRSGVRHFDLVVVHPLFSSSASMATMRQLGIKNILISDAYPAPEHVQHLAPVTIVKSIPFLAEAVRHAMDR
jgi:ribose-phosphate pyrophosphokinase